LSIEPAQRPQPLEAYGPVSPRHHLRMSPEMGKRLTTNGLRRDAASATPINCYALPGNALFFKGNPGRSTGRRSCIPSGTRAIMGGQITETEGGSSVSGRLGGRRSPRSSRAESVFVAVGPSAEVTRSGWDVLTRPLTCRSGHPD
jgi:hypothetical protein